MKLVILGGGFGGLEAAKYARKYFSGKITLVNDAPEMIFHAHLHEIISEKMLPKQLEIPLEEYLNKTHIDFVQGVVKSIKGNKVILNNGILEFDALIIALGSKTAFFSCKGVENKCDLLKNPENAVRLLEHLKKLSKGDIAITGAGLTGVELAFEIREFAKKHDKNFNIHIIEAGNEVLHGFPKHAQEFAIKQLEKNNIHVELNCKVKKGTGHQLIFANNKKINYDLLIWAAGIKPSTEPKNLGVSTINEFIKVNNKLQTNKENIFAIGDIAYVKTDKGHDPWTATSAIYQGRIAGKNAINFLYKKNLVEYKPGKKHLFLVSLGKKTGVMTYGTFCAHGKFILVLKKLFRYWYRFTHM